MFTICLPLSIDKSRNVDVRPRTVFANADACVSKHFGITEITWLDDDENIRDHMMHEDEQEGMASSRRPRYSTYLQYI